MEGWVAYTRQPKQRKEAKRRTMRRDQVAGFCRSGNVLENAWICFSLYFIGTFTKHTHRSRECGLNTSFPPENRQTSYSYKCMDLWAIYLAAANCDISPKTMFGSPVFLAMILRSPEPQWTLSWEALGMARKVSLRFPGLVASRCPRCFPVVSISWFLTFVANQ